MPTSTPTNPQTPTNQPIVTQTPGAPSRPSRIERENQNPNIAVNLDSLFAEAETHLFPEDSYQSPLPTQKRPRSECTPIEFAHANKRRAYPVSGFIDHPPVLGGTTGISLFGGQHNLLGDNFNDITAVSTPDLTDRESDTSSFATPVSSSGENTPLNGVSYLGVNPYSLIAALAQNNGDTPTVSDTEENDDAENDFSTPKKWL